MSIITNTTSIISFLKLLGNLKHLPRTGWVNYKVDKPETVGKKIFIYIYINISLL